MRVEADCFVSLTQRPASYSQIVQANECEYSAASIDLQSQHSSGSGNFFDPNLGSLEVMQQQTMHVTTMTQRQTHPESDLANRHQYQHYTAANTLMSSQIKPNCPNQIGFQWIGSAASDEFGSEGTQNGTNQKSQYLYHHYYYLENPVETTRSLRAAGQPLDHLDPQRANLGASYSQVLVAQDHQPPVHPTHFQSYNLMNTSDGHQSGNADTADLAMSHHRERKNPSYDSQSRVCQRYDGGNYQMHSNSTENMINQQAGNQLSYNNPPELSTNNHMPSYHGESTAHSTGCNQASRIFGSYTAASARDIQLGDKTSHFEHHQDHMNQIRGETYFSCQSAIEITKSDENNLQRQISCYPNLYPQETVMVNKHQEPAPVDTSNCFAYYDHLTASWHRGQHHEQQPSQVQIYRPKEEFLGLQQSPASLSSSAVPVCSIDGQPDRVQIDANSSIPRLDREEQIQKRISKTNSTGSLRGGKQTKVVSTGSASQNPNQDRLNQCQVCGRNYARPSTLKTHLRTHTNERPFKCSICSKTFSQAANLTAHQRVHTGERPFSCPICGRQFSQSSSVITHLRTHSGERPYRCSMCDRTFSDSSTLTKHCRIHSGEKPYHCNYCPLNFSQSGNLSRHLKLHLAGGSSGHDIERTSKKEAQHAAGTTLDGQGRGKSHSEMRPHINTSNDRNFSSSISCSSSSSPSNQF